MHWFACTELPFFHMIILPRIPLLVAVLSLSRRVPISPLLSVQCTDVCSESAATVAFLQPGICVLRIKHHSPAASCTCINIDL